jgi:hypothetical protein
MRDFAGQALQGLATRLRHFGIKAFQSHSGSSEFSRLPVLPLFFEKIIL